MAGRFDFQLEVKFRVLIQKLLRSFGGDLILHAYMFVMLMDLVLVLALSIYLLGFYNPWFVAWCR